MGFLLNEIKAKVEKIGKTGASSSTLRAAGCKLCPLNKADVASPKMQPSGTDAPVIYVLGEAPGKTEDDEGEPLVGDSGKLLKKLLADSWAKASGDDAPINQPKHIDSYVKEFARFDNVIRDRPPKNRTPTFHEIECCRGYLENSIVAAKPLVVVGLGAVPLHWVTERSGILDWRGSVIPCELQGHPFLFMPTIHPSYVLRSENADKEDKRRKVKLEDTQEYNVFVRDMKRIGRVAYALAQGQDNPCHSFRITENDAEEAAKAFVYIDGSQPTDLAKALTALARLSEAPEIAFDIETSGDKEYQKGRSGAFRPYGKGAKMLSVSFGNTDYVVAIALDHKEAKWSKTNLVTLKQAVCALVKNPKVKKIAQNLGYELEWFGVLHGEGVIRDGNWGDTMAQAYVLGTRPNAMSLGALTMRHFGIDCKKLSTLGRMDLDTVAVPRVLKYNAFDVWFTYALHCLQNELVEELGLQAVYAEQIRRVPMLVAAQMVGVPIDFKQVSEHKVRLDADIAEIHAEIKTCPEVIKYEEIYRTFNPQSDTNCAVLFRDVMKRPEGYRGPDEYSTDKEVLKQIDLPIAEYLMTYREHTKLLGTYVEEYMPDGKHLWPDGRVHTNYNSCFVGTRRLSSDNPNMQNAPKRSNAWIRTQFIPPAGHSMVSVDYGQIEARVAAMLSKDKRLIKYLWERYDIHQAWALKTKEAYPKILSMAAAIDPTKDPMKNLRQEAKNKFVFPAIFGAQAFSISGNYGVPEEIIEELLEEFWREFSGVADWQDEVRAAYKANGYVETLTGYRRYEPLEAGNAVINSSIQGTASDIVVDAMNRISERSYYDKRPQLQPYLNVHDDIGFFLPYESEEEDLKVIITDMLTSPFDFINVPLTVEASNGKNWYEMEAIGDFSSDEWLRQA